MVGLGLCGWKVIEDPVRIQQRWGSQIKSEAVAFLGRTDVSDKGLKAKLIEAAKFRKRGSRRNQQQDEKCTSCTKEQCRSKLEEEFKVQPQVSPSDQEDMTRKDFVSALYLSVDGGVRGRPGAGSREGSRQRGLAGKAWPGSHQA